MTICLPRNVMDIVVVSDLHAGSRVSPCPNPSFLLRDGASYEASRLQVALTEAWWSLLAEAKTRLGARKRVLVCNGDLIEGNHHGTTQLVDPDAVIHKRIALALLRPWSKMCGETFVVRGTKCHVGDVEEDIAEDLKAECVDSEAAPYRMRMRVGDSVGLFSHHISTSTRDWSDAGALSGVLAAERLEAAKAGQELPRFVVRSHRHKFAAYSDGDAVVVTTPAMQALTDFTHKVVPHVHPVVGVTILSFTKGSPVPTVTPLLRRIIL